MNGKALIGLAVAAGIVIIGSVAVLRPATDAKKILFIDSYHEGYPWSDGITAGIQGTLTGADVDLKIHRMDTKRNGSEMFKKQAALNAKALIDEFNPDVVIATDDNASKYLIVPYYRGGDLPFVFAGVNWDASVYGFPASNVTGMVEVSRPNDLLDMLRTFSGGVTLGSLTGDTATGRKENGYYIKEFGITFEQEIYVTTFEEWKQAYLAMQDEVDILLMYNNVGIDGWNDEAAARFVRENTRIPSGSVQPWMAPYVLIAYTKDAREQGEWAATTAMEILAGRSPADISMTTNMRGRMMLNSALANHMQLDIPSELLSSADEVIN